MIFVVVLCRMISIIRLRGYECIAKGAFVPKLQRLSLRNIWKAFYGQNVNKGINLEIQSGEILGLLGENGAGKTTLMNILYGLYRPDKGQVLINGEETRIESCRDAISLGIGMVHQHFMLVENMSVWENIALGEKKLPFWNPKPKIIEKIKACSEKYGLNVPIEARIWQLSVGQQQRVEILKAIFHGAELLILDEPTSVLTPDEITELFTILHQMKEEGHSAIIISHKLDEIMTICDKVMVIRKGEYIGSRKVAGTNTDELTTMMVGDTFTTDFKKEKISPGSVTIRVEDLHAPGDRGEPALDGVSFEIRQNEIFGIAGVSGNGQRELVESLTGLRKSTSGKIFLQGKDVTNKSSRVMHNMGISHIPEERIRFGIVPNLFISENAVLKKHHTHPFSKVFFLDYKHVEQHAEDLIANYNIDTPGSSTPVKNLSGGNIQKLILGREISQKPSLLVASHPTYGLDIQSARYIRQTLLAHRRDGGAILLVSEDLEELFMLCDSIAVLYRGKAKGVFADDAFDKQTIGRLMAGLTTSHGAAHGS